MVPLLAPLTSDPAYDTLDVALAAGSLRVTEVSDAGHVPEIRVVNKGDRPVLIIDGEELVGAGGLGGPIAISLGGLAIYAILSGGRAIVIGLAALGLGFWMADLSRKAWP